jgi:hypothetical protein
MTTTFRPEAIRTVAARDTFMENDFGLDVGELLKVIDTAEVLVIRFAILEKHLLVDARHTDEEGPLIKIVPRVDSVEERFRHLKSLRPKFPLPEKIMSFMWPRHVELLEKSGVWQHILDRLTGSGYADAKAACDAAWQELLQAEQTEVQSAMKGGETYQSLWERKG